MEKITSGSFYFALFIFSIYYILTGLWPLIRISSFIYVAGFKTDIWLVKTIGILLFLVGAYVLISAIRKNVSAEMIWYVISVAAGLTFIDIYYVLKEVISPIYLLDAFAEILLIIFLLILLKKNFRAN